MHLGHATLLFLFVTVTAHAAVLRVGPGKPYASPSKAIAAAADGDIIEIDAGTYTRDVCAIRKNRLTLRGVNGRAKLDAAGANADSKGIWVIYGNDTVVENIEFTGAQVRDQNGSGIWLEGNNLTVRNCYFHHNEEGILTGKTGTVLIEYSEFAYNGNGEGFTHNLYIGAAESFTFRYCYSHHAIAGHLVKSRAAVNYILYNRLTEEPGGNGSFELDLPNGGTSYVIGNIIQKSVESENYASVAYFEEGPGGAPGGTPAPGRQLYVVNNTFSTEALIDPDTRLPMKAVFVFTPGGLTTPVVIKNNIFTGPGDITNQANAAVSSNYQGDARRFADTQLFDYRLLPGSPAIDAGADLGDPKLAPTMQYVHPACVAGRKTVGPIDAGAYEFGGQISAPASANLPEACLNAVAIVSGADFQPGLLSPGSFAAIFGDKLASSQTVASGAVLPGMLGGVSVTINGVTAPLYSVSPGQVNLQIPWEVRPGPEGSRATATVAVYGVARPAATFRLAAAAPHVFTLTGPGGTPAQGAPRAPRAIVFNEDLSLNGPATPAAPQSAVSCYLTGQGSVDRTVSSGSPAPLDALVWATLPAAVTVGGRPATLIFLGLTPGQVGIAQANFRVPDLPDGDYPVVIDINGVESNPAMISVASRQ